MRNIKGFTLIEMLVVIAIVSILVSIVLPTVTSATDKAAAATDAANLRSVLGYMNAVLLTDTDDIEEAVTKYEAPVSKWKDGASLFVIYTIPGVIDVYFVDGNNFYGLDYLSEVAQNGADSAALASISTAKPNPAISHIWYKVGVGAVEP